MSFIELIFVSPWPSWPGGASQSVYMEKTFVPTRIACVQTPLSRQKKIYVFQGRGRLYTGSARRVTLPSKKGNQADQVNKFN